jgi:RNA polymerase sigma factor for flagellar operon FliA
MDSTGPHYLTEEDEYVEVLWQKWSENPSNELRNELFNVYFQWLKTVVSRFFSKYKFPTLEWDDCLQYSSLALLESIDRYNPTRGVPFKSFVYKRIEGAMLNGAYKETSQGKKSTTSRVELDWLDDSSTDNSSTDDGGELDTLIGYVLDVAYDTLLSKPVAEMSSLSNPYNAYAEYRQAGMIRDLIDALGEPDHAIMRMYYLESVAFKIIAKLQGLSKSRISQIHKRALRKIRNLYEDTY